jgi:hypothetical protein
MTTRRGKLLLTEVGGLAEFEHKLICARASEGHRRAVERGVKLGRKRKLSASARKPFAATILARGCGRDRPHLQRLAQHDREAQIMISDDEIANLPSDPELAFVRFEGILRQKVQEYEVVEQQHNGDYDAEPYRLMYMNQVAAAANAYGIEALSGLEIPKLGTSQISFIAAYRQFLADVDHVTIQIRIHAARADHEGTVGLEDIERTKIHHFIQQIRIVIENADIPDDKRDALFDKLNKFAAEVDRKRTKLQTAMAVIIAICDGIGQGFEKLEPAQKMINSISVLLGRAKENEERADKRLPPPTERKRIEPPKQRLASPRKIADLLDDDIPF